MSRLIFQRDARAPGRQQEAARIGYPPGGVVVGEGEIPTLLRTQEGLDFANFKMDATLTLNGTSQAPGGGESTWRVSTRYFQITVTKLK